MSRRLGRERREMGGGQQGKIVGRSCEVHNVNIMHQILLTVAWRVVRIWELELRRVDVVGAELGDGVVDLFAIVLLIVAIVMVV